MLNTNRIGTSIYSLIRVLIITRVCGSVVALARVTRTRINTYFYWPVPALRRLCLNVGPGGGGRSLS